MELRINEKYQLTEKYNSMCLQFIIIAIIALVNLITGKFSLLCIMTWPNKLSNLLKCTHVNIG